MPEQKRKLAAIMFTDIVGYTESMSIDEQAAIQAVRKKRSIIQPLIKEHSGIFVKEIGDGTLSYFGSAIDAATCAVKLQAKTFDDEFLNIRIGLHVGDIVFDGEDVFGEGVNIASRLESISPAGGICVSKNVFDELENKKQFNGTSLGLQSLKGVGRLVEVFALNGDKLKEPDKSQYKATEVDKHTDDEIPSIAIIPFDNKGADEDDYYAYSLIADLISDVTGSGLIRVASLNDIERLDYQQFTNNELSKELLVRYIAQGTLWKKDSIFQLSMELYDTKTSDIVWSERWEKGWKKLNKISGELAENIINSLNVSSSKNFKSVITNNTFAYDYYLKGKFNFQSKTSFEDIVYAREMLNKALELDNNLLEAKILLGRSYLSEGQYDEARNHFMSCIEKSIVIRNQKAEAECNNYLSGNTKCNNIAFYTYKNKKYNQNPILFQVF